MDEPSSANQRLRWYQTFAPSIITLHHIQTGEQVREPSLVALNIDRAPKKMSGLLTGMEFGALPAEACLAVGSAALSCQGSPGAAVFSPLRHGQIADYTVAQHLFRELYRQMRSKSPVSALLKPVFCVHEQEYTTEVEERALIEAAIQLGARRVLLYQDSFSAMLNRAQNDSALLNSYILHIEPQD